jgi:hypothetical protein
MSNTPDEKYRDQLVAIIKDVGQELIDRAEEMVSEDASFIKDFSISIDISNPREGDPTISWTHSTLCTRALNRMTDAKFRPTILDKNKKKGYWVSEYDPFGHRTILICSVCGEKYYLPGMAIKTEYPNECHSCHSEMDDMF